MTETEFDSLVAALQRDADGACSFVGFLASVMDNQEAHARLNGSYSGYAGAVAQAGVKQAAILYCARAWDGSADAISLVRVAENLPPLDVLIERKIKRSIDLEINLGSNEKLEEIHIKFNKNYIDIKNKEYHPGFRVLRSEVFAHRVNKSRDRIRYEKSNISISDPTWDDLIDLSISTLNLIGDIGYLWYQLNNPYPDKIKTWEKYCREFWRLLPVLGDVERF